MATQEQPSGTRNEGIIHARVGASFKKKAEALAKADNRNLTNWLQDLIDREDKARRQSAPE
jgi:hypothetical protein